MLHDKTFTLRLRVYYEDTDASGVVYHANYLHYLERARTEWLDHNGLDHRTLADKYNAAFTLSNMSVRFICPARLDDRLTAHATLAQARGARVVFAQAIYRDEELLLQGQFTVVCVNMANFRPRRLPEAFLEESK